MAKSYISPFNDRQYMLSDYFELYYYEIDGVVVGSTSAIEGLKERQ